MGYNPSSGQGGNANQGSDRVGSLIDSDGNGIENEKDKSSSGRLSVGNGRFKVGKVIDRDGKGIEKLKDKSSSGRFNVGKGRFRDGRLIVNDGSRKDGSVKLHSDLAI
jgi:hypothetical protein